MLIDYHLIFIWLFFLWNFLLGSDAIELTFELEDNSKQCFYELIDVNVKSVVEFQVITGGNYDVDMKLTGPNGKVLYEDQKKQYDSYQWTTDRRGEYKFCFSNEFSTFAHKVVYFDFQAGEENVLFPETKTGPLSKMETAANQLHESMSVIIDYQTHHRLREATGRIFAEDLSQRVLWYSSIYCLTIIIVTIGQVLVLRSFFSHKKTLMSNST